MHVVLQYQGNVAVNSTADHRIIRERLRSGNKAASSSSEEKSGSRRVCVPHVAVVTDRYRRKVGDGVKKQTPNVSSEFQFGLSDLRACILILY